MKMSGGALTDYGYDGSIGNLSQWARRIRPHNPILADHMVRLEYLLDRYDYYLSGDIGEEDIEKEWKEFLSFSINDEESMKKSILKECEGIIDTMLKGYREGYY